MSQNPDALAFFQAQKTKRANATQNYVAIKQVWCEPEVNIPAKRNADMETTPIHVANLRGLRLLAAVLVISQSPAF